MLFLLIGLLAFAFGMLAGSLIMRFFYHKEKSNYTQQSQESLQSQFGKITNEALKNATDSFFTIAEDKFKNLVNHSKEGIDSNLNTLNNTFKTLSQNTNNLEGQLKNSQNQIHALDQETKKLNQLLSNSQERGSWGERAVEDILNFIGMVKGQGYLTQHTQDGQRPDFTFLLPHGQKLNMDTKFPLDNYKQYLQTQNKHEQNQFAKDFITNVRHHIKAVASRNYINPLQNTLDYALIFIPNESIYTFINQFDQTLVDYALEKRMVLCSPITLYAILSLIRQASNSFTMEKQAAEIQNLILKFKTEWQNFVKKMDQMERALDSTRTHFDDLKNTRSRQLDKPMTQIETMMKTPLNSKNLPPFPKNPPF